MIFEPTPDTDCSCGIVNFRMFNVRYAYTFDQLADLLHFPHGNKMVCEVPYTERWKNYFQPFWRAITGTVTHSFKGNTTIRYFSQLLACTIFGRPNSNKVNEKELFYLFTTFVPEKVNIVSFMISHMFAIVTAKKGAIVFGGLITSIARVL
ncbi:unnamed protein product [Vicia faba]|uniref:Arabidopsis retrotransposon Orf1 C-terminal domain-containing protein n=1 Tax=Vicia faba TaxID=3906 RepID=A0AAV0Z6T4_VICFA|nr:unnamed protein product [Vicia faba]